MKLEESLYVHTDKGITTIEFESINANCLSSNLLNRIERAFLDISEDKNTSVIVLKSGGLKTFCAGASLKELSEVKTEKQATNFFLGFSKVIKAMINCKKVIIGRVQGKSVGGAVGIITGCDFVFSNEASAVKLSELAVGIGPFVIAPILINKIGKSAFSELVFEPTTWKNAYWAKEKGLFHKVYETTKEMDIELDFFLSRIASYNNEALKNIKKIISGNTEQIIFELIKNASISGRLILSDYCQKALKKYVQ